MHGRMISVVPKPAISVAMDGSIMGSGGWGMQARLASAWMHQAESDAGCWFRLQLM